MQDVNLGLDAVINSVASRHPGKGSRAPDSVEHVCPEPLRERRLRHILNVLHATPRASNSLIDTVQYTAN